METVLQNIPWMGFNIALAGLGLAFGWLFYYIRKSLFAYFFFILWILFIPNTIYLITDLQHLPEQLLNAGFFVKFLLGIEYLVVVLLGILTFIVGMYPIDKLFSEIHLKNNPTLKLFVLFLINCTMGLAIVLGKFQRTHSWYVFTDVTRVIKDILEVFTNPVLFLMVILFGLVINLTYFAFKNIIHVKVRKSRA